MKRTDGTTFTKVDALRLLPPWHPVTKRLTHKIVQAIKRLHPWSPEAVCLDVMDDKMVFFTTFPGGSPDEKGIKYLIPLMAVNDRWSEQEVFEWISQ